MSVNAMETALWRAYTNHDEVRRYLSDRAAYLDGFELDAEERRMLLDSDVAAQIEHGANSLLVMMAWQVIHGMENVGQYFALVNGPPAQP
jgi:hypothetical protein